MHPAGLPSALASLNRPLVMGVLNVTPDSFSDGGRFLEADAAVRHGRTLAAHGADIVDVGGESTRPGAQRVSVEQELERVLPVVEGLSGAGIAVSIDTTRAEVAEKAVGAGAMLINDVSGGLADVQMVDLVAQVAVPYVVMHWRGPSAGMSERARYGDVVREVCSELADRLTALTRAGVDLSRVVLDPGLGFAKESAHNWALLRAIPTIRALGHPVLIGASRKRFLGELLAGPGGPRPVGQRDAATDAITALAVQQGAWGVRVHDVSHSRDVIAVAHAWSGRGG